MENEKSKRIEFGDKVYTVFPWPEWSQLICMATKGITGELPGVVDVVAIKQSERHFTAPVMIDIATQNGTILSIDRDRLFLTPAMAVRGAATAARGLEVELRARVEEYGALGVPGEDVPEG